MYSCHSSTTIVLHNVSTTHLGYQFVAHKNASTSYAYVYDVLCLHYWCYACMFSNVLCLVLFFGFDHSYRCDHWNWASVASPIMCACGSELQIGSSSSASLRAWNRDKFDLPSRILHARLVASASGRSAPVARSSSCRSAPCRSASKFSPTHHSRSLMVYISE